jgi:hypothetical protein
MSVSFPSASGGASYDPSTYLSSPAAAIPDPVDTVDLTSIGRPPAVTAASIASSASTTTPASSNAATSNGPTSNYGTGNNSLSSLYGTGNSAGSGTANSATSNLASLLDPPSSSTSNSITSNLAGYLNPTANGNPSSPASTTTPSSSATASADAASASNASAWQQEYQNFLADNTTYLLENTFGASSAIDQPSAAFGSSAAISAITNSTLGVLSQAAALQNPQTLAFQEPSTSSSTGGTVDTTA